MKIKKDFGSTPSTRNGKQPAKNLFVIAALVVFLTILINRLDLVLISFRSIFTSLMLFVAAPEAFKEIFTSDIIEFWIGALYLLVVPVILLMILKKSFRKRSTPPVEKERSLSSLSLRAFMKQSIALYASAVIFILYSAAFLAPFIAPFSPYDQQDFLVTAYQPPFSRVDALILKQSKTLTIPIQQGNTPEIHLANNLISDFQALKTRNEPHALRFINEYHLEGDSIVYRQGIRTKKMPFAELASSEGDKLAITRTFILGTDQYGRDILSRVIYGSKISLSIGFLVVLISVTLGTVIGVTSGYFGGWIDAVMMRLVDVLIAFPALFLILIIIATFGNSIYLIVITLSFTGWMGVARIVRSQVLSLKEQEFILAAKSLGLSNLRIIFRHLAPNTMTPVIIAATLRIGSIILTEAGLSFLGLGVQPPTPSWGNIINEGRDSLLNYWWISTFPGIAILTTVVCFNLIGDGVRDALDPRMRG